MKTETTSLPDALVFCPSRHTDDRGWFSETWNEEVWRSQGLDIRFVQDNHSCSLIKGTLRGLHYQRPPRAQDKLVRCTRGAVLDVAVDVRTGSSTYGKHIAIELTPENGKQLLVPKGFLHGFLTLTDDTEVQYKCSDTYAPECDGSVRWDSLCINWGVADPILSRKDAEAIPFSMFVSPF